MRFSIKARSSVGEHLLDVQGVRSSTLLAPTKKELIGRLGLPIVFVRQGIMVQIQGQDVEVQAGQTCADVLRAVLSGKKMKSVVACDCDGALIDLTRPVPAGTVVMAGMVSSVS